MALVVMRATEAVAVVFVEVVSVMIVVVVLVIVARMRAALGGMAGHAFQQASEIGPKLRESLGARPRALVHVKAAIDFDLKAVTACSGIGERAHELDAL